MAAFKLQWLLFALAVSLAGPVVATVVFEFWPVIFAVLTLSGTWRAGMLGGSLRTGRTTASMLVLLVVGGTGVAFAVMSDSGEAGWSGTAVLGLMLACLATACSALGTATAQMMGVDQRHTIHANATAVSTSGGFIAQAVAAPIIALIGVLAAAVDSAAWWTTGGVLLAVCVSAIQVPAFWCYHHANHLSRQAHGQNAAQINSIFYLTPVGALLLLVAFADTTIERPDLLIIGAAGVVVANMILHLDPEGARQRAGGVGGHGYRALVLTLWGAGALVLLRDDWLPDGWQVWSVAEYWGVIGVCATVFILILSFRQQRLAERRRDMDALTLSLHRDITFLGECGDLNAAMSEEAAEYLRNIDTAREPQELSDSYFKLRTMLMRETRPAHNREHAARLSRLLTDVEVLVNLRQQGRNFTELAVLTLFASLTVALAVAARPDGDLVPFAGWVHDTTSLVIAAAFAFLGFDLIDKRREADAPILLQVSDEDQGRLGHPPGWRLRLVARQDRTAERVVASLMGAALLVGAVVMLGIKWL